jgi:hypothetical protein
MGKLIGRLQDASRSGVYRSARADEILDAAKGSSLFVARIRVAAKDELLKSIAAALAFPDWFGGNWDALEDCLSDLSWRPAAGYVLIFDEATAGDDLGVLIDVLGAAASSWAARGKPFFAVLIDATGRLALPPLFRQA